MARWILFRDRGEDRRPLEVARCQADSFAQAVDVLAHFVGDTREITRRSGPAPLRALPFFVQSAASAQCESHTRVSTPRPSFVRNRKRRGATRAE